MVVCPVPSIGQTFTVVDTVYTPANYIGGALSATLYKPETPKGTAVILLHGILEDRSAMTVWGDSLAANGYLAMSIDYPDPIVGGATFPAPPRAIKTAVQFLRSNASKFGISTTRIGSLGISLGAGLVSGAMIDEEDYAKFGIPSNVDDHLDFAVLFYGLYDYAHFLQTNLSLSYSQYATDYFGKDQQLQNEETPVLQADKIHCPILLLHGTGDQTIQYQQSVEFDDSLRAHGRSSHLILFPGQTHLFDVGLNGHFSDTGNMAKDSVLLFLEQNVSASVAKNSIASNGFSLEQNYPNPFGALSPSGSSQTVIRFELQHSSYALLRVYNGLGEIVRMFDFGSLGAGLHTAKIQASALASGVYYYELEGGENRVAKSMVVMN
jgi:acetyl esterase/lipase